MALRAEDIAEMLGVPTVTVSLVLNSRSGVSEKRHREVIQKIKEMDCGYILKEQRINNGSIGFAAYKHERSVVDKSPFFIYILEGINSRINHYGYTLNFLYISKTVSRTEQKHQIKSGGYKGLIIFAVEVYCDNLQLFKESQIPSATLDNSFQENDIDTVSINSIQGTSKAVSYLCGIGHREIEHIRSKVRINSFDERYNAFKHKLRSLGGIFNKEYVVDAGYSEEDIKRGVKKYLESHKRLPTALFVESDLIGCSVIRAIQECGYRVPEDISVVGSDNRLINALVEPQLTTINMPKDIFRPAAVDLLISRLDQGREQSLKVEIGTSLVKRGSVKKVTDWTKSKTEDMQKHIRHLMLHMLFFYL